jgi:hypothetical protein
MYRRSKKYCWALVALLVFAAGVLTPGSLPGLAADDITLVIDGQKIEDEPRPLILNDRTLVPVRLISEKLGAVVEWNDQNRTVGISSGDRSIKLMIDSHLVEYNDGERTFDLCDVPPRIIGDRTFVPIRLVSNALGVHVDWDDASRTVYVDSTREADIASFFDISITTVRPGQVIDGVTWLKASAPDNIKSRASEIRYLLLDPATGRGNVIARGSDLNAEYKWLPDLRHNGQRALVAVVYDQNGAFLGGHAVAVTQQVVPQVNLTGLEKGKAIKGNISLGADTNFVAAYVKYQITNKNNGKSFVSAESDPEGSYTWAPMVEDNGQVSFSVTAYDHEGNAFASQAIDVEIDVERRLELRGVSAGGTVDRPVTLSAYRNFQVSETEYVMRDPKTGSEEVLARVGYTGHRWFPGPELSGTKELFVRVKDTSGRSHTSDAVKVNLTGKAMMLIEGVGPQQVVTGPLKLKVSSNVELDNIRFVLTNPKTGKTTVIAEGQDALAEYTWTPSQSDGGDWSIHAEGIYAAGNKVASQSIPFKVYMGKIYSAQPVVEKSKFLDLASNLAGVAFEKTGMSAALQTAQAILETGWGQSVPVDKYTGKLSYNLFGIKGTGPAGSVISNTWEEYNGTTFRVDAGFRAYNSVDQSWADHKNFLLTGSRYQTFREVMHDSTRGAWALKRAGYATDSQYPIKLMNIIKTYNLDQLDQVRI